mgnify:CR=1 FL=1
MATKDWKKTEANKINKIRLMIMKLKTYKQHIDKNLKQNLINAVWQLEDAQDKLE